MISGNLFGGRSLRTFLYQNKCHFRLDQKYFSSLSYFGTHTSGGIRAPRLIRGVEYLVDDLELREAVKIQDFRAFSDSSPPTTCAPKILLTCEHASNKLPRPFYWSPEDLWVQETHWAYDIGASEFATELGQALQVIVCKSQFSRLLVDPNRPLASETLFRQECDGKKLVINTDMTKMDRNWRIWHYYLPYHQTLGLVASKTDPRLILSLHSFNPFYEGSKRDFEIGVLCTTEDHLAAEICANFQSNGFLSRINMPWSGKEGFMYSADSLKVSGPPGNRRAIMIELRNDLVSNDEWRSKAVKCLANSLLSLKAIK